ncbi:Glomulin, ubiquitin-protein transferase inhibitor Glm2 [Schizosaccharomyces pombe]|uniref:UPF0649 protein C1442.02 n=1 Tax=Schizosaccharomyces pombe (strain 972 / ATCC 24843) TaxID=284812 RepID=YQ72_SCHPO|nr:putative central kinetochore-associated family protein [Schizosaccharomyces pombe]Q76PC4.1 RecName: Full=UPF0649 protein C1442.02 [Schizosaccharomyces pombe 972h-]CAB40185.1 central kinetochore associated family protein (predicted) [Schizosaccharomyces pombe]|eukprot:NP_588317.1 putative central kinetochore-associated family protein [Schizosaccharomyces pombe]
MDWKEAIPGAAKVAIETKDYITYSTLLELILEEARIKDIDEQRELIKCLHEELKQEKNDHITREISWDIIGMVLPYVGKVQNEADEFVDFLAKNGNPREVFLKCCELLINGGFESPQQFISLNSAILSALHRISTKRPVLFVNNFLISLFSGLANILQIDSDELYCVWKISISSIQDAMHRFPVSECYLACLKACSILAQLFLSKETLMLSFRSLLQTKDQYAEFREELSGATTNCDKLDTLSKSIINIFDYLLSHLPESWSIITEHMAQELTKATYVSQSSSISSEDEEIAKNADVPAEVDNNSTKADDKRDEIEFDTKGCLALLTIKSFYQSGNFFLDFLKEKFPSTILETLQQLVSWEIQLDSVGFKDIAVYQGYLLDLPHFQVPDSELEHLSSLLHGYHFMASSTELPWLRVTCNAIVTKCLDSQLPSVRLSYILDTLEECPLLNIKTAILNYYQKQCSLVKDSNEEGLKNFVSPNTLLDVFKVFDAMEDVELDSQSLSYIHQTLVFLYSLEIQNLLSQNQFPTVYFTKISDQINNYEGELPTDGLKYYIELLNSRNK